MNHTYHQPALPGLSPTPSLLDLDPRRQLWMWQKMRCAGCSIDIPPTARAARSRDRGAIAALLCHSCVRFPVPPQTPADSAPALLRLRLRQAAVHDFPVAVGEVDRRALATRDWDFFRNPLHVLWTAQDGRCALPGAWPHSPAVVRALTLEFDPEEPCLLRGIVCLRCRHAQDKGVIDRAWRNYRRQPPAAALAATRGLTRRYIRAAAQAVVR